MIDLTSPKTVSELLARFELSPLKQLGQNFLFDFHMLDAIADGAQCQGKAVLEIGPGMGALTQRLAAKAQKVVAVEIDRGMVRVLEHTLEGLDNVQVLHGDIMKQDLGSLGRLLGQGFCVCANLPYYITTPVIMRLLESDLAIDAMCFLVQKEVAERMGAGPGSKAYGALSIAVQYRCEVKTVVNVPPGCFVPRPEVESRAVRLTPRESPVKAADEGGFLALVRCAFGMRRKTLVNNLAAGFGLGKDKAAQALESVGLEAGVRGEALTIAQFVRLSDQLTAMAGQKPGAGE